ncbi:hypothetical protein D0859_05755 [Hortaea werneckii]|uniref:Uncharacterized protein n=1 Tax=Hortaea werneckii TaxID=91943 RepID=A0A3M7IX94_HORWE|nr:hypothetical protein D0859_05755 [Hortaea werneckii]
MPLHLPPVRASPMGRFDRPFRYQYQQRRTFLGLRRPPPPKTPMMGYLVAQGLAVVLLADLGIAMLRGEPTTVRSEGTMIFWEREIATLGSPKPHH